MPRGERALLTVTGLALGGPARLRPLYRLLDAAAAWLVRRLGRAYGRAEVLRGPDATLAGVASAARRLASAGGVRALDVFLNLHARPQRDGWLRDPGLPGALGPRDAGRSCPPDRRSPRRAPPRGRGRPRGAPGPGGAGRGGQRQGRRGGRPAHHRQRRVMARGRRCPADVTSARARGPGGLVLPAPGAAARGMRCVRPARRLSWSHAVASPPHRRKRCRT